LLIGKQVTDGSKSRSHFISRVRNLELLDSEDGGTIILPYVSKGLRVVKA